MGAEAEKELKQAKVLGVGADSVVPSLGEALLLQNEYKRILDEINLSGNESAVNKAKILRLRGYALTGLGKWDEGCSRFKQALDSDAGYAPSTWGWQTARWHATIEWRHASKSTLHLRKIHATSRHGYFWATSSVITTIRKQLMRHIQKP